MSDSQLISLQPGTIIAGRYEVIKCLGEGSMGLVYACRHRELSGHLVGVKVLFPEVARDKIAAARFRNEIFASYGVSHPNVVRAYEFIKDGDLVAYTMEYVGGGDLADRLSDKSNPIPIDTIIKLLSQMCAGVQAIHDVGIVHRDLKPENILLTKDGDIKIADFGIARTGHGPKLTEHGGVVGTIDYVSPEYMLNSQVDWRSDIYALGILTYEMLTGESPFKGDSVYAVMTQRLKTDPKPPSSLRSDCPPGLDEIVLKAMCRDPEQRYQSSAQMYYDLQVLGKEQSISVGSSMQISESASKTYIGPSIEQIEAEAEAELLEVPVQPPVAVESSPLAETTTIISDFTEPETPQIVSMNHQQRARSKTEQISPSDVNKSSSHQLEQPNDPGTTEVRSEEIADLAKHYKARSDGQTGPVKMESLLSRHSNVEEAPTVVSIQSLALDDTRFRRLSKNAKRKSISADIIVVVLAVVLGVGIGYFVIKSLFPDLISSDPLLKESVKIEATTAGSVQSGSKP